MMKRLLWYTGILPPNSDTGSAQLLNGQLYTVGIGNRYNGPNAYFGGCLGPYAIQRFQLSSACVPPPVSDCLVGFIGDSYVAGGGVNGGGIFPGTATVGQINADSQTLLFPDDPGAGSGLKNVNGSAGGVGAWIQNLEAYCCRQLGYYFRAYGAAKSGYSTYFTGGYASPIAAPTPAILFTAPLSAATAGTIASCTVNGVTTTNWPFNSGAWTITFPDGTQRAATFTLSSASVSWSGAVTEPNANTAASAVYTTAYWDALNNAQPEVVVILDSVNNGYECPSSSGSGVTPAADLQYICNYLANGNANLRQIILVEMTSLEKLPAAMGGTLTPAQWASVSATWRTQIRAAFNNTGARAGSRGVPIIYVPTYERFTGAANGTQFIWGSNTNNVQTSGGQEGPNAPMPNIHPCPDGAVRLADIVWPYLKSWLQGRQQWANA